MSPKSRSKNGYLLLVLAGIFLMSLLISSCEKSGFFKASFTPSETTNPSIKIQCNNYMSGVQSVDILTNHTNFHDYKFFIDGTEIASKTNDDEILTGQVLNSYYYTTSGTITAGNATSLNYFDARHLSVTSSGGGTKRIRLYIEFSMNGHDLGTMNNRKVTLSYKTSRTTVTGNLRVENLTSGNWVTLTTLAGSLSMINVTTALTGIRPHQSTYLMRFYVNLECPNTFTLDMNLFKVIFDYQESASDCFKVLDNVAIDTTFYVDGLYNLTARMFAGTKVYETRRYVIFDNTLPEIDALEVQGTILNDSEPITIMASISDDFIESSWASYVSGDEEIEVKNGIEPDFSYTNLFKGGIYEFKVFAIDKAMNIAESAITFTVDHSLNLIYIPNIIVGYTVNTTVGNKAIMNITANDTGRIEYYQNGSLQDTFDDPTGTITVETESADALQYDILLKIYYQNLTFYDDITFSMYFIMFLEQRIIDLTFTSFVEFGSKLEINVSTNYVSNITILLEGIEITTDENSYFLHYETVGYSEEITELNFTVIVNDEINSYLLERDITIYSLPKIEGENVSQQGFDLMLIAVIGLSVLSSGLAIKLKRN